MINRTLHTSCKNCLFADYTGETQTSCKVEQLDYFRNHDVEVIEAYDETKEFYIINNKICMKKRTEKWKHSKLPYEAQLAKLKEESRIYYQIIIFADDSLDDVKLTLNSILAQTLQPSHLTIVRKPTSQITPSSLAYLCQDLPFEWKVENIINPELTKEQIIDLILSFNATGYYGVVNAGYITDLKTFEDLSRKIIDELFVFAALLPTETNKCLVIPYVIHEYFAGNNTEPLIEKLKKECPEWILPMPL